MHHAAHAAVGRIHARKNGKWQARIRADDGVQLPVAQRVGEGTLCVSVSLAKTVGQFVDETVHKPLPHVEGRAPPVFPVQIPIVYALLRRSARPDLGACIDRLAPRVGVQHREPVEITVFAL